MAGEEKRRGGWPARELRPGERVPMSFRVTPEFKRMLDDASAKSGKSLSQEVEARLEQSFRDEQHLEQALELIYGKALAGILTILGDVMQRVGARAVTASHPPNAVENGDWLADPYAFDQASKAAGVILDAIRPEGDPGLLNRGFRATSAWHKHLGEEMAGGVLSVLTLNDPYEGLSEAELAVAKPSEGTRQIARMKALLGSIVDRIKVPQRRDLRAIDQKAAERRAVDEEGGQ